MNPSENDIENLLRRAPAPRAPEGLAAGLIQGIDLPKPVDSRNGRDPFGRTRPRSFWHRWWPVTLPALASAALAAGWLVQQGDLAALRAEVEALRARWAVLEATPAVAVDPTLPGPGVDGLAEREALDRLRGQVETLQAEVDALERVRAENESLRAALKSFQARLPQDLQESAVLQERAQSIQCVNNLKQLGLAVRVWATDNSEEFPPDILSMTNEMGTPKILVCPADEGRQAAASWSTYTPANLSYDFLTPGPGKYETEPSRLLFRCPIHGHVGLCDGSVQMAVAKNHPERLESVNGALYLRQETPPPPPSAEGGSVPAGVTTAAANGSPPVFRMNPTLAARYGLTVVEPAVDPGQATNAVPEVIEVDGPLPNQP